MNLTEKQEKFCNHYIHSMNAFESYKAVYSCANMKDKTVYENASRVLRNKNIQARLKELKAPVIAKVELQLEEVLRENMTIAFSDIRQFFDDNNKLKPMKDWTPAMAGAVSSIKVYEDFIHAGGTKIKIGETKEIKFWDKGAAIDKLMKHLGAYEKDNQQKTNPLVLLMQSLQGSALPIANANIIDVEDFDDDDDE